MEVGVKRFKRFGDGIGTSIPASLLYGSSLNSDWFLAITFHREFDGLFGIHTNGRRFSFTIGFYKSVRISITPVHRKQMQ